MQGQAAAALAAARAAEAELRRLPPPVRWPAQEADTALVLGLAMRALGQRLPRPRALAVVSAH